MLQTKCHRTLSNLLPKKLLYKAKGKSKYPKAKSRYFMKKEQIVKITSNKT